MTGDTVKYRRHGANAAGPQALYGYTNDEKDNSQSGRPHMKNQGSVERRYRKATENERVMANYELSQKIERERFDDLANVIDLKTLPYESIATKAGCPNLNQESPLLDNIVKYKSSAPRIKPVGEKISGDTSKAKVGDITQSTYSVMLPQDHRQGERKVNIRTPYTPYSSSHPPDHSNSKKDMAQLAPPAPVPTPPPHKSPLLKRMPQLQHNRHRSMPDVKHGYSVHSNWNLPAPATSRSMTPSPGFAEKTALPKARKAGSCIEVGPKAMSCSECMGACVCTSPTSIAPRVDTPPWSARRESQLSPESFENGVSRESPRSGKSDRDRSPMGPYQGKEHNTGSPATHGAGGSTMGVHMHDDTRIEKPIASPRTPSTSGTPRTLTPGGTVPTPPPHQPSRISSPSGGGNNDWSHSSTGPDDTQKKFAPHINSSPAAPSPSSRTAYSTTTSRRATSVVFPSSTDSPTTSTSPLATTSPPGNSKQRELLHRSHNDYESDSSDEEDDSSGEVYFVFTLNWWSVSIMGTRLPGILVPYIWPTSPSSFFTGLLTGFLVAHLRPRIEHYLDIWATYVSSVSRFAIVWGSIGLICWGLLRLIQQTSAAAMNIPADPQKLAYEAQALPPPQAQPQVQHHVQPQAKPKSRSRAASPEAHAAQQQYEANLYLQQESRRQKQQQQQQQQQQQLQQQQQQQQQQQAYDQSPQFEPQYYESDQPRTVHHYQSHQALPKVKKSSGGSPHNNVMTSPVSLPPPQPPSHYDSLSSPEQSPVRKVRSSASSPRIPSSRSPSPNKPISPVVSSRMQLLQQQEDSKHRRNHSVVSEPAVSPRRRAVTPVPTSDSASIVTSSRSMTSFDSIATDSSYDSYTTKSSRSSRTSNSSLRSSPSQYSIAPSSSVSNMIKRFSVDDSHSYKPYPARPSLVDMQIHEMENLPHSEGVEAVRVLEKPRGHSAFRLKR